MINKRILTTAVAVAAVAVPANAGAMYLVNGAGAVPRGVSGHTAGDTPAGRQHTAYGAPSAASGKTAYGESASSANTAAGAPPSSAGPVAATSAGFKWDDAALGAAGALVLVGLGSGTTLAVRRRTGPLVG